MYTIVSYEKLSDLPSFVLIIFTSSLVVAARDIAVCIARRAFERGSDSTLHFQAPVVVVSLLILVN